MITELSVRNFKSIGDEGISIELKPLVIFVGPNRSGKSSILHAIDWLSTKTENPKITALESYDKEVYGVNDFIDLVHRRQLNKLFRISITIELNRDDIKRLEPLQSDIDWNTLGLSKPKLNNVSYTIEYNPGTEEISQELSINDKVIFGFVKEKVDVWRAVYTAPPLLSGRTSKTLYGAETNILSESTAKLLQYAPELLKSEAISLLTIFCSEIIRILHNHFSRTYLISARRGGIAYRTLPDKVKERIKVGKMGENVLEILALTTGGSSVRSREIGDKIMFWSSIFGLNKLFGGIEEGALLRATYEDPELNTILETSLASQGSRQTLALITQLFHAEPNSTIMIEEPEISLHPGHQVKLPLLFADAVNDGKQVIITTHSTLLVLALSYAVQGKVMKGWTSRGEIEKDVKLDRNNIIVYHVTRDKKGCTTVERLKLSDEGLIEGGVPSFVDVERELYKTLFRGAEVE
jgi:ABC-type cobalamin/Fe3+-siderophores transport system ATPase subunit